MRAVSKIRIAAILAAAVIASPAAAQTSLTGGSLALQSAASATLSSSGYVGTYLTVPVGGATVKFTVNATASSGASPAPHMNLAIADTLVGFSVSNTAATNYTTGNITLPAGTYVIRNERDYSGNTGVTRSFTVNNLSVSTVSGSTTTFSNSSTDANALAAANTYIGNYRQGSATVALSGPGSIPLLAGTPVNVDLARHAFNFGGTVSGVSASDPKSMVNVVNPAPGTEAYKFQQFINSHFNMIVPSNAGKWASNESTRDAVTMSYVDTILNYAQSHNMRARMHNLIWGSQQPAWVTNGSNNGLLDQAADTTLTQAQRDTAKADLRAEITERTQYYVNATRANQYAEVDVYNESYHTGSNNSNPDNYWNVYGASGVAGIYNEVQQAVANANSSAKIYTNEYNVFQWGDAYGNWYRQHIDSIRGAGGAVSGIGFQYYADPTLTGSNLHSPARMEKALMGLSTEGLPLSLTEFGLSSALTTAQADSMGPGVTDDSMRMMFGTPQVTSFLIWGWWDLATNPTRAPAALLDNTNGNNTLTPMGVRWEQLMNEWDTNLTATVNANGTITFKGFYGDYYLRGQTGGAYDMTLAKGTSNYSITLAAPPTWSLWNPNVSGTWGSGANWTAGGVANSAGQTAYFGSAATARSITVDGTRTVGMIAFDSSSPYTLSGGAINLQGFNSNPGHVAAIYVKNGSHTINSALTIMDDTTITVVNASDTLAVANLQPTPANVSKSGSGKLLVNAIRANALNVSAGTVAMEARGTGGATSKLTSLSLASGAKIDLVDTALVTRDSIGTWNGSAYTGVAGLLAGGYNGGGWSGSSGIVTSMSSATGGNTLTTLGVATADETGYAGRAFMGVSVAGGDTLVMYTYAGDANLDGIISGDDYFQIDSAVSQGASGWFNGDFNYDGVVNGDDYFLIDSNFPSQGPSLGNSANPVVAVPEPITIGLQFFGMGWILLPRKRLT